MLQDRICSFGFRVTGLFECRAKQKAPDCEGVSKPTQKQENYLPQTDRASAFVVDRVKIFLASSLITMQNFVFFSHTVCGCRMGRG